MRLRLFLGLSFWLWLILSALLFMPNRIYCVRKLFGMFKGFPVEEKRGFLAGPPWVKMDGWMDADAHKAKSVE
jgi:hypothetical protein